MFSYPQTQTTNFEKPSFKLVKVLSSSRFPVILVEDSTCTQTFVLKLFPHTQEGTLSRAFVHEASVLSLTHSNLIKLHHAYPKYSLTGDDQSSTISALVMDYALNGDLCKLLKMASKNLSEEAARTLFHQLIEGLEFLHDQGFAHMDLKPDNLLLGDDYTLKIGDFDQVTRIQNSSTPSKGTPGYRAPEVKGQNCCNLTAADIFSAGVVLFVMRSRVPPFVERNISLYDELIKSDNSRFWEIHCRAQKNDNFFSETFKDLFTKMLNPVPEKRPSIQEIKKSAWYNGPTLSQKNMKEELARL